MVSEKSAFLIGVVYNVGSILKLFPGVWDDVNIRVIINFGKPIYLPWNHLNPFCSSGHIMPVVYLIFQGCNVLYLINFLIFAEYIYLDMCLGLLLLAAYSLALSAQSNFILQYEDFTNLVHVYLEEDREQRMKIPNNMYFNIYLPQNLH